MKVYHFPTVDGRLLVPHPGPDGENLTHFVRSYYVNAPSVEKAVGLLHADLGSEGAEVLGFDPPILLEFLRIPFHVLTKGILNRGPGVLWKSGRAFFPPDSPVSLH